MPDPNTREHMTPELVKLMMEAKEERERARACFAEGHERMNTVKVKLYQLRAAHVGPRTIAEAFGVKRSSIRNLTRHMDE